MELNTQRLRKLVNDMQAELDGHAEAQENWQTESGFPKLKEIAGSTYLLSAPLNPDWKAAPTDLVLGGTTSGGVRYLKDPSNADAEHPARSPAGYPLFYGIEGDGKTNSDRLPARVLYDGQTHENDAAVEEYKRAVVGQGAESTHETAASGAENVLKPGQSAMSGWNADDLEFYEYHYQKMQGYGGPRLEERRFINGAQQGTLNDFNNPNMQTFLDRKRDRMTGKLPAYKEADYTGSLRGILAKR